MSTRAWLFTNTIILIGALAGAAQAAPADANTAAPTDASESSLNEVVVTAARREQALKDVPQAVQALTQQELAANGIEDLKSTLQLIPGATSPAEISAGTEVYSIRGVSPGLTAGSSTVGFYLDEFSFNVPGVPYAPSANVYDTQRVEVIRGPSGTLYGQGSLGGTIKIITNNPDLENYSGSVRATLGQIDDVNVPRNVNSASYATDMMANIPLVNDVLGLRLVLSDEHIGGFIHYPNWDGGELYNGNEVEALSGRAKLLFEPTQDLKITLTYWGNNTVTTSTNRMDNYQTYEANDTQGHTPVHYSVYMADINYDLGFANLLSASNYMNELFALYADGNAGPPNGQYAIVEPTTAKVFSQEFRISSEGKNLINYVVGAFFQHSTQGILNDFSDSGTPGVQPFIGIDQTSTATAKQYAVYGELSANLLDGRLIPTIGGRYFTERQTLNGVATDIIGTTPPSATTDHTAGTDSKFTPRFNLAFHPTDDGMIYAEVAEGFRSGFLQSHAIVAAYAALNIPALTATPADSLWNYEIGAKWNFQHLLYAEVSLYDFQWKQAQLDLAVGGTPGVISVGNVEGRGVDLTLNYRTPIEGLQLGLTGNVNSTEMHDVKPGITAALPYMASGQELPGTSRVTGSINAEYTTPLKRVPYDLRIMARYLKTSGQQDLNSGDISANVGLLNFRIGVSDATKSLTLFLNNATAEHGPLTIDAGRAFVPYPREFGVTLETKF
jgi:iron complex outermembrane receptor protein